MSEEISSSKCRAITQLLYQYATLLRQIDKPHEFLLDSLFIDIVEHPLLSQEEKLPHQELIAEIAKLSDKFQQMNWMSEHLKILHELGQTFTKTFEKEEIYQKAFELVSRVMRADSFFIAFYNEGDAHIYIPFSIDSGVRYQTYSIPYGSGFISKVISTKQTIHIKKHDETKEAFVRWGNPQQDTNTCIFVPMMLGDQVKGVISAQSYEAFAYGEEHEELLKIIGFQVASAVETARLYEMLYQSTILDELSGIKNYRAFHQDLEKQLSELEHHQNISLVMLDSDNLKKVNDQYGHHMGDKLIQRIAEALVACKREGEEVYRYAGDEFMILAPDTPLAEAERRVYEVTQYLEQNPLIYDDQTIPITVSAGIAMYPQNADGADGLKRAADAALYQSKKRGKNCSTIFSGV